MAQKVKLFRLSDYLGAALRLAEYDRDEEGVLVATVPEAAGFLAQGATFEEARANLRDVIEGNVLLALQLGWDIPSVSGFDIEERDVEARPSSPAYS